MPAKRNRPEVTIIIPNLNGKGHLDRCFTSLREMNYDQEKIEYILVDNGSIDGSVNVMNQRFPEVRVIANQQNLGFSVACNLGAKAAQGEFIVFLNNDMRVDPEWLNPLVDTLRSGEGDCVTSLILSWDGTRVNYGGAGANFHGIGIQEGLDDPDVASYQIRKEVLFGCGGSLAMKRDLFLDVGGFDEEFFAYFEDVDLGWRLWVLGHKVLYVPESRAYHHHSATSKLMGVHKIRVLYIRNPLYMIFKNYSQENLVKILPAALMLTLKRMTYLIGLDDKNYRFNGKEAFHSGPLVEKVVQAQTRLSKVKVPQVGLADLVALNDFIDNFKTMRAKRAQIQKARKRPDEEILPLFQDPFWAVEEPAEYEEALKIFADFFDFSSIFDPA